MKSYLGRLFQHMSWADLRVLGCLRTSPEPESLRLFAHLLAAESVWLYRLQGRDTSSLAIWPESSFPECETAAQENRDGYTHYLSSLPETQLTTMITYRNSAGAEFSTVVLDILTQVLLHGSYHRGQIAMRIRNVGSEPVNTDFITFAREQGAFVPLHA